MTKQGRWINRTSTSHDFCSLCTIVNRSRKVSLMRVTFVKKARTGCLSSVHVKGRLEDHIGEVCLDPIEGEAYDLVIGEDISFGHIPRHNIATNPLVLESIPRPVVIERQTLSPILSKDMTYLFCKAWVRNSGDSWTAGFHDTYAATP